MIINEQLLGTPTMPIVSPQSQIVIGSPRPILRPAAYQVTLITLCSITFVTVIWVPIIYIFLWHNYSAHINRISIRQMTVIGIANIVQTSFIFALDSFWITDFSCRSLFWLSLMTRNFTAWLSFTVVLNLQLVVCHRIRDTRKFEIFYYLVPAVISLVPYIVTVSMSPRPDVVVNDYCFNDGVANPRSYGIFWVRGFLYTVIGITCSVFSIIYVLVYVFRTRMLLLREGRTSIEAFGPPEYSHNEIIDRANEELMPAKAPALPLFSHSRRPSLIAGETAALQQLNTPRGSQPLLHNLPPTIPLQQQQYQPPPPRPSNKPHKKIANALSSTAQKISSWKCRTKNTIHTLGTRYQIINPLLLRLIWIPVVPLFSIVVEIAAYTLGSKSRTAQYDWLHGWADGMFVIQAIFQAIPFYTDSVIKNTLKIARRDMIFTYFYSPYQDLIMESLGNDEIKRSQFRKASFASVFSRGYQASVPSARMVQPFGNRDLSMTLTTVNSDLSNGGGRSSSAAVDEDKDENGGTLTDNQSITGGGGGDNTNAGSVKDWNDGEVERAFWGIRLFVSSVDDASQNCQDDEAENIGHGSRPDLLLPKLSTTKEKFMFYFVRFILLTRSERRVYKRVFGRDRHRFSNRGGTAQDTSVDAAARQINRNSSPKNVQT
ncbi:hypothetical protein H4219_005282 [Mycoemilia scoparia]|uniref:Uncharacterized protein n=1 Tax=Mycoemilia scoparia TaxID=417184 RepID=A0A9W7ZWS1_9FUNG|nr:hypothetical protein H4219_005282 [Mycoemilia scoparia]